MKLTVLSDEKFSCQCCGDCCRHQMVELFAGEPEKIAALQWPAGDPLNGVEKFSRHGGKIYYARQADGACVFLNQTNGLCRIHEEFGPEAKCTACRIFPFQITPTFGNEAAVTARYDCPTVRKNMGDAHTASLPLLRTYTEKWTPEAGFDDATCCHLDREQLTAVTQFLATLMPAFKRNDQRALFAPYLADALATTAADSIDRAALGEAFGPLKQQIEAATVGETSRPGVLHRAAFRTLLALHLRRDEDVVERKAGRLGRLTAMIAFVFGFGSFCGLGLIHPKGSLRQAGLFKPSPEVSVDTTALVWRLMRIKLESFTFMGRGNGGRDFLTGLRSLSLLYPLMMAAAKFNAAARGSATVEPADMDYAAGAVEHSFGRAAVLGQPFVRSIERLLTERTSITRLMQTI